MFGRGGQVMAEKRGSESGLAEAWCYEHGNREEDDRDGVITQTETLMGYASDDSD